MCMQLIKLYIQITSFHYIHISHFFVDSVSLIKLFIKITNICTFHYICLGYFFNMLLLEPYLF
jgi:hypothetical protein